MPIPSNSKEYDASRRFLINYLDTIDFVPNEIQPQFSKIRELNREAEILMQEIKELYQSLKSNSGDRRSTHQIHQQLEIALLKLRDIGDKKLVLAQTNLDIVDSRSRALAADAAALKKAREQDAAVLATLKEKQCSSPSLQASGGPSFGGGSGSEKGESRGGSSISRRSRRGGGGSREGSEAHDGTPSTTAGSSGKGSATGKRDSSKISGVSGQTPASGTSRKRGRKTKSPSPEDMLVDPDEPVYCICERISFGDMVGCDNDLCPIEWFHFQCVQLTTKPKGKWYCFMCRGERANQMKPKSAFLKELEKYKKEKEAEQSDSGSAGGKN